MGESGANMVAVGSDGDDGPPWFAATDSLSSLSLSILSTLCCFHD